MRKLILSTLLAGALLVPVTVFADAQPPTNGGNGAGSSGNCTGPAAERPTSCQSPGGVSGK